MVSLIVEPSSDSHSVLELSFPNTDGRPWDSLKRLCLNSCAMIFGVASEEFNRYWKGFHRQELTHSMKWEDDVAFGTLVLWLLPIEGNRAG